MVPVECTCWSAVPQIIVFSILAIPGPVPVLKLNPSTEMPLPLGFVLLIVELPNRVQLTRLSVPPYILIPPPPSSFIPFAWLPEKTELIIVVVPSSVWKPPPEPKLPSTDADILFWKKHEVMVVVPSLSMPAPAPSAELERNTVLLTVNSPVWLTATPPPK